MQSLSNLSKIVKVQNTHIKNEVENIYNKIGSPSLGKIELDLPEFQKLDLSVQQNLILYTISKALGSARNIEKVNVDDIIKMCKRNVGNKYIYPNKNLKILIENKKIIFIPLP